MADTIHNLNREWVLQNLCNTEGQISGAKCRCSNLKKQDWYDQLLAYCPEANGNIHMILHMILEGLKEIPTCALDGCNNKVSYNKCTGFTKCCCQEHLNKYIRSTNENNKQEVLDEMYNDDFLKSQLDLAEKYKNDPDIGDNVIKSKYTKLLKPKKVKIPLDELPPLTNGEITAHKGSIHVHKTLYNLDIDWVRDEYGDWGVKVINCCPEHGDSLYYRPRYFYRRLKDWNDTGKSLCLKCCPPGKRNGKATQPEIEVENILTDLDVKFKRNDHTVASELDFYLPEYGIGLEINGVVWHSGVEAFKNHLVKRHLAAKHNVRVYFLWEDECLFHQDKVREYIKTLLAGKEPEPIFPQDKTADYFFVNSHSFQRTYSKEEINDDYRYWKLCYVIKNYTD